MTYVAARFSSDSLDTLESLIKILDLKDPVPRDKIHCTIVSSKNLVFGNFKALGPLERPWLSQNQHILSKNSLGTGKIALVLNFQCTSMEKRRQEILNSQKLRMKKFHFQCHVTLSYDAENVVLSEKNAAKLLPSVLPLEIVEEYSEPYDNDWETKL